METARPVGNPETGTSEKPQFTVVETDRNPLYISLSQAAKIWRKHKGTISRHVKDGKLQWHDQPDGERRLYAPEIAHLYGAPPVEGGEEDVVAPAHSLTRQAQPPTDTPSDALLQAKDEIIRLLQEQLNRERQVSEQWRLEFVSLKDQIKALPEPAKERKSGWWPFGSR